MTIYSSGMIYFGKTIRTKIPARYFFRLPVFFNAWVVLLLMACAHSTPVQPVVGPAKTVAEFPNGTFLENGDLASDGTLYFTSYFDKKLYSYKQGVGVKLVASLAVHPVGVLITEQGFLLSAHGVPFTAGPMFTQSNQLLELNKDGGVKRVVPVADGRFLNGMTRLADNSVLIADSIAGIIWRYQPGDGVVNVWLEHQNLAPDQAVKEFRPGANGLKMARGQLLVSNSSRGVVFKIQLTNTLAPSGVPILFASTGPIDDFISDKDGNLYASTHSEAILRISNSGQVTRIIESGCDGCTSVFFDPDVSTGRALLFLTTGGMLEGGKNNARIARLRLN